MQPTKALHKEPWWYQPIAVDCRRVENWRPGTSHTPDGLQQRCESGRNEPRRGLGALLKGGKSRGANQLAVAMRCSTTLKHTPKADIKCYQPVCKVNMLKAGKQPGAVNVAASNIEPKPGRLRAAPQTGADMGRPSRSGQDVADVYYESGDKVSGSAPRNHILYHSNGKRRKRKRCPACRRVSKLPQFATGLRLRTI